MAKAYFAFGIERLHEKGLVYDMEKHMTADHKRREIPEARRWLEKARKFGLPKGGYTHVEIRPGGVYLKDKSEGGLSAMRVDFLKHSEVL